MSSRIVLLLAGVAASLLLLEVAVRVVTAFDTNYLDEIVSRRALAEGHALTLGDLIRPSADDAIVYELRPGVRGRFLGVPVAINSLGMRDGERPLEKGRDVFRIVGIGDSHMFGWGVRRDETFLARLEKELNARFSARRFEVWNLAVPGYNSVQEVETFAAKARALHPDLVIINWVGNDMDLPSFLAKRPDVYSARRSFLIDLVRRRWRAWRGKHVRSSTLFAVETDPRTGLSSARPEAIPERYRPLLGMGNMLEALDRLAALVREDGIRAVALFDWNVPDPDTARAESHDPSRLLVKRWCAARGYVIVDTEERVLRYLRVHRLDARALRLSTSDPHPSPLRHRLIAETLLATLVRSEVIDEAAPGRAVAPASPPTGIRHHDRSRGTAR